VLGLDIPTELRPHLGLTAAASAGSASPDESISGCGAEPETTHRPAQKLAPDVVEELAQGELTETGHWLGGPALQCERVVTPTGNITVGRHQIWIGFAHVGRTIGVWADTTIHLAYDRVGGPHFKTVRPG
jgi:hypothetical protein